MSKIDNVKHTSGLGGLGPMIKKAISPRMERFLDNVIEEVEEVGINDEFVADEPDSTTAKFEDNRIGQSYGGEMTNKASQVEWRVGKSVPINVYEGDRPVFQCHTSVDARRIVEAVNAKQAVSPQVDPASLTDKPVYYVASRASIPERGAMWRKLRGCGANIISSWIDEDGEGCTESFEELWQRIEREIKSATALLLYVEGHDFPLKGALVEVGMAIAMGKPVLIFKPYFSLDERTCRPLGSWVKHPAVTIMSSSLSEFLSGDGRVSREE